jgi:caffeoyl-CoA O-methyltransferase
MEPIVSEAIEAYATEHTTPLPPLLEELIAATGRDFAARAGMLSGPIVGSLLQTLVRATGAKRVLEIGMFTGFSALMMATALPEDGELVSCDVNPRTIAFAQSYFARSPHGRKIVVREGPALDTIKTVAGPFGFVFIDADKENYLAYYEATLPLLADGGLIAVDNVLWDGRVLDPKEETDRAIVAFNDRVRDDPRVACTLLSVRDGVMLIRPV